MENKTTATNATTTNAEQDVFFSLIDLTFFANFVDQLSTNINYEQDLNILYLNTTIRNKKDLLEAYIADKSFAALCFSEHWLNEEEVETPLIDNYKIAASFTRKIMTKG